MTFEELSAVSPTISTALGSFMETSGIDASSVEFSALPPFENEDGNWVCPVLAKPDAGEMFGLGMMESASPSEYAALKALTVG